ncbi:hypothetical protein Ppa06_55190 [Planomonospora parontospora subsp. parontospora]|uniref:Uncharacterized protein n=2 Tax=Planomonospora parontospora TaxID=58119 RepID=A0AA37BLC0_9ACTN|nr:hypothetical protein GCM10010126_56570 [Planomonospora parontospora]GII11721.1 hypothetical protein Ppa06_55190 [Planomonospora parontospora subsp. parontospora]
MIQSAEEGRDPAPPLKSSLQTRDQPEGVDGTAALAATAAIGSVSAATMTGIHLRERFLMRGRLIRGLSRWGDEGRSIVAAA